MRGFPHRLALLSIAAAAFLPGHSGAVIVAGGDGTQNAGPATPVTGAIGNNVGLVNGATAVYLQNGWVLTAAHVGSGSVFFPALNLQFSFDGLQQRLTNPDGSQTDLLLFHLSGTPALQSATIGTTSGAALAATQRSVVMNGYGQTRDVSLSYFDVSTNPWTVSGTPTTEAGYFFSGPNALRYGSNQVVDYVPLLDYGSGKTDSFITDFNPAQNPAALAQGSSGDSGGPVFSQNPLTNEFELIGIMLAIGRTNSDLTPGQPANTAVYNTTTYGGNDSITAIADLSSYRVQINTFTAVPEPGTIALVLLGSLGLVVLRRSRVQRVIAKRGCLFRRRRGEADDDEFARRRV